jgi:type 1 glutamine amidotransferase
MMNYRFLRLLFLTVFTLQPLWAHAAESDQKPKKILFFSKSSGFEHSVIKREHGEPSYVERLLKDWGPKHQYEFTFSKDGSLFSPSYLEQFDGFFFYTTGDLTTPGTDKQPPMSKEGKAAFLEAIRNGKAFIGTHSASDTFHSPGNAEHGPARFKNDTNNVDPYIAMIGAEFIKHGAQQKSHLICSDPKFPGMEGFPQDFKLHEEWYSLKNFATNLHVLLVQDTADMKGNMYERPPYPSTWARLYGKGRVFYTNMGHREDVWTNSAFQKVLIGGMDWALSRADADIAPNLDQVTPKAMDMPPFK